LSRPIAAHNGRQQMWRRVIKIDQHRCYSTDPNPNLRDHIISNVLSVS
jgi:hypothetical protein